MASRELIETTDATIALQTMTKEEIAKNAQWIAVKSGMKAFVATSLVSVPGTYALVKYSAWFAKRTGTSGRVATAFIPPLFAWTFMAEQTASRLANPDAYVDLTRPKSDGIMSSLSNISAPTFLVMAAVPTVAGIFYYTGRNPALDTSQRIMHTRVMGQASVLTILSGIALYHLVFDDHSKR